MVTSRYTFQVPSRNFNLDLSQKLEVIPATFIDPKSNVYFRALLLSGSFAQDSPQFTNSHQVWSAARRFSYNFITFRVAILNFIQIVYIEIMFQLKFTALLWFGLLERQRKLVILPQQASWFGGVRWCWRHSDWSTFTNRFNFFLFSEICNYDEFSKNKHG